MGKGTGEEAWKYAIVISRQQGMVNPLSRFPHGGKAELVLGVNI
jgi:hypothetical protein